jgi:hypothetical protein
MPNILEKICGFYFGGAAGPSGENNDDGLPNFGFFPSLEIVFGNLDAISFVKFLNEEAVSAVAHQSLHFTKYVLSFHKLFHLSAPIKPTVK